MLRVVYTEHKWYPWMFKKLPLSVLGDPSVVQEALAFVETLLQIEDNEGWYEVKEAHLKELGLFTLIDKSGGLFHVLKQYRPDYPWDETRF